MKTMRMKILTKSTKGLDIIVRTENIDIKDRNNLEEEVRQYNSKHYCENLIECWIYNESNV